MPVPIRSYSVPYSVRAVEPGWHIEGRRFERLVPLGAEINAYCFSSEAGTVAVLLSAGIDRPRLERLPDGWLLRDAYGDALVLPAQIGHEPIYLEAPGLDAAAMTAALPRF